MRLRDPARLGGGDRRLRKAADLPPQARAYVRRIEELIGRPVGFISVGSERSASIITQGAIEGLR